MKIGRLDDHGDGTAGGGISKKLGVLVGLDCRAATGGSGRGAGELTTVQAEKSIRMTELLGIGAINGQI